MDILRTITEPRISKLTRIRDEAIKKKKMLPTRIDDFQPEWQKRELQDDTLHKLAFFKKAKKKSPFRILKDNRRPLTPEERAIVMKRRAVWHHGERGEQTPAVWKSVNPQTGKITFVTNTHRAYNTAPSVRGAISRFHKFIKGTA